MDSRYTIIDRKEDNIWICIKYPEFLAILSFLKFLENIEVIDINKLFHTLEKIKNIVVEYKKNKEKENETTRG